MKKILISFSAITAITLLTLTVSLATVLPVRADDNSGFCYTFSKNLGMGNTLSTSDAQALQTVLEKEGLWNNNTPLTNYNENVASAVSDLQEKYSSEVLAPEDLSHGTGYVGPLTRSELNNLFSCTNTNQSTSSTATCQPGWLFNPMTGIRCTTTQSSSGVCTNGALYNYLTGVPCSASTTSPPTPPTPITIPIIATTSSAISISSSVSPAQASPGTDVTINWTSTNAPDGSAVALTLFNNSGNEVGVLTQDADSTGSYDWSIPTCVSGTATTTSGLAVFQTCTPTDSNGVYETPVGNYTIVAKLYTPKGGYGGGMIAPSPSLQILATSPAMPFAVIPAPTTTIESSQNN